MINALTENKGHIPYRDSKLTRLLSDALGGNAKTYLIVTTSCMSYNLEETIGSLRFGQVLVLVLQILFFELPIYIVGFSTACEDGEKQGCY